MEIIHRFVQNVFADYHRRLLQDTARTDAFRRAIAATVKPGSVVADVGAGSGILSLFCAAAGARRVYALEANPVTAALARQVIADNGFDATIELIANDALLIDLAEKVDVVVSECIGWMMYGGTMFGTLADIRDRCLAPGGRVIPRAVTLFAAPVESPANNRNANFFRNERPFGFDVSAFAAAAQVYLTEVDEHAILAEPAVAAVANAETGYPSEAVDAELEFTIRRSGRLHGFALWFEADLCEGVVLTTAPGRPLTIWQHTFISTGGELVLSAGTRVGLHVQLLRGLRSLRQRMEWTVTVGNTRRHFSTANGLPLPEEEWVARLDGRDWLERLRDRRMGGPFSELS